MARICMISGKKPLVGNRVSHAHNKTKHRQLPSLVTKSFYSEKLNKKIKLKICTRILRTIDKKGLDAVLQMYDKNPKTFA